MKEQFVSLAIAQKLKEKGFDQSCMAYVYTGNTGTNVDQYVYGAISHDGNQIHENYNVYDMSYSLPLWQQVIDWLREKHRFIINIDYIAHPSHDTKTLPDWTSEIYNMSRFDYIVAEYDRYTYQEARQAAIEHALTLI